MPLVMLLSMSVVLRVWVVTIIQRLGDRSRKRLMVCSNEHTLSGDDRCVIGPMRACRLSTRAPFGLVVQRQAEALELVAQHTLVAGLGVAGLGLGVLLVGDVAVAERAVDGAGERAGGAVVGVRPVADRLVG